MWLMELMGMTVVAGVALGVVWRVTENFFEQRAFKATLAKAQADLDDQEQPTAKTE